MVFAFVVCLLTYVVSILCRPRQGLIYAALFALTALGCLILQAAVTLPAPFNQWLYGMPAVFMGLALVMGPKRLDAQVLWLVVFSVLALGAGATAGLFQLVLATSIFLFCTTAPSPDTPLARQAGAAAMGVYLAHPLFLSILTRATPLPEGSLSMAIAACLGALALTLALTSIQSTRQRIKASIRS